MLNAIISIATFAPWQLVGESLEAACKMVARSSELLEVSIPRLSSVAFAALLSHEQSKVQSAGLAVLALVFTQ